VNRQCLVAVADPEHRFFSRVSVLRQGDGRGNAGIGDRFFCDSHILDLHVVSEFLPAESDGVHWKPSIAQCLQRIWRDARSAHARGVLTSVSEQNDCAHRKVRRLCNKLFQAVVNVGGCSSRCDSMGVVDPFKVAVEPVETSLKPIRQARENSAVKRPESGRLTGMAIAVGNRHAVRIVDDHGNDVLLRTQFPDRDRGLPQQQQQQGYRRRLHSPDQPGAPAVQRGRRRSEPPPNDKRQAACRGNYKHRQQPRGPRAEQHEAPPGKNR
jgi:hypothetical protein